MHSAIKQSLRMVDLSGLAAVVLLAAGAALMGVLPMLKQGREAVKESGELQAQIAKLDELDGIVKRVELDRRDTEARLQAIEKRLPTSSETNTFIKELAKVTETAGIRVDGTQYPKELKEAGRYKALPVEVIGSGDWESCYRFLSGLRSMNRLTRLDALTLDVDRDAQKNTKNPSVRISINFSTFFLAR